MDKKQFSEHIALSNIKIEDSFWSKMVELVRNEVIPYQLDALNDRIEDAEKSYSIENFLKAGKIVKALSEGKEVPTYPVDKWCYDEGNAEPEAFHGWVFQDSDAYKWLEAVGYSLINHPDEELKRRADEIVDIICEAQLPNGYLDTLYIINNRDEVFTNLKDFHELYCFGHLAEGAIAYYKATGNERILSACCRFADLICETFGENKIKGYPGHEIAEMALVKLYDLTGKQEYLSTAEFFINERGRKPYYYDLVLGRKTVEDNYHYNQAHLEPRKQREAVGHAVRGVYLYSGMADIAKRRNDDELFNACKAIFDNIESKKLYITGGIGANVDGESFSFNYDLPNDLAYSETCASIGLIFFARRMLEIEPNTHYADVMERALYNTVLSGMAQDGKSFFYVNPLEVLPEASHKDSRKRHIKPVRQKWFGCACCPPNLARLISSIGEYCFTENDEIIYIHQYIGGKIKGKNAELCIKSDYATSGRVEIEIEPSRATSLAIRLPSWCREFRLSGEYEIRNGYAYFIISDSTHIEAEFYQEPKIISCSNRVRANIGRVAVTKGPFVYCIEEADNGKNLQCLKLNTKAELRAEGDEIIAQGVREALNDKLYSDYAEAETTPVEIKFIPYYRWGNRGENEMSVYVNKF